MRIEELLERESHDQMYREKAAQLYSRIVQRLPDVPITEFRKASLQGNTAFMIDVRKLGINDDMTIVIASPMNPGEIGGYDQNSDNLFIFMPMKDFTVADSFEKKLKSRDMKRTIIHELIHKFDSQRTNYQRKTSDMSIVDYYNSPDEYNAYYQEAVQEVEQLIERFKRMGRYDVIRDRFGTYEEFSSFMFKQVFDSEFLKYLNGDNMRRLNKRLFRYWDQSVRPIIQENLSEHVQEAVYQGMIGFQEMMMFMKKANEQQKKRFQKFLENGNTEKALELLSAVTGENVSVNMMRGNNR